MRVILLLTLLLATHPAPDQRCAIEWEYCAYRHCIRVNPGTTFNIEGYEKCVTKCHIEYEECMGRGNDPSIPKKD